MQSRHQATYSISFVNLLFRFKKVKDDTQSAYVLFYFFHKAVNSYTLVTANHIFNAIFVLHIVLKIHLLNDQNLCAIQIITGLPVANQWVLFPINISEELEFLRKNPNVVLDCCRESSDWLGHQHHHDNLIEVNSEESLSEFVPMSTSHQ